MVQTKRLSLIFMAITFILLGALLLISIVLFGGSGTGVAMADPPIRVAATINQQNKNLNRTYTRDLSEIPIYDGSDYTFQMNHSFVDNGVSVSIDYICEVIPDESKQFKVDDSQRYLYHAGKYPLRVKQTLTEGYEVYFAEGSVPYFEVKPIELTHSVSISFDAGWDETDTLYYGQPLSKTTFQKPSPYFTHNASAAGNLFEKVILEGDVLNVELHYNSLTDANGFVNKAPGVYSFDNDKDSYTVKQLINGVWVKSPDYVPYDNPNVSTTKKPPISLLGSTTESPKVRVGKRPITLVLDEESDIITRKYGTVLSSEVSATSFAVSANANSNTIGTNAFYANDYQSCFPQNAVPYLVRFDETNVEDQMWKDAGERLYPISLDSDHFSDAEYQIDLTKYSLELKFDYKLKIEPHSISLSKEQHGFDEHEERQYGPPESFSAVSVNGLNGEVLSITFALFCGGEIKTEITPTVDGKYLLQPNVANENYEIRIDKIYTAGTEEQNKNYVVEMNYTPTIRVCANEYNISTVALIVDEEEAEYPFEANKNLDENWITMQYGTIKFYDFEREVEGVAEIVSIQAIKARIRVDVVSQPEPSYYPVTLLLIDEQGEFLTQRAEQGTYSFIIHNENENYIFSHSETIKINVVPFDIKLTIENLSSLQANAELQNMDDRSATANLVASEGIGQFMYGCVIAKYKTKQMVETKLNYFYQPTGETITIAFEHDTVPDGTALRSATVPIGSFALFDAEGQPVSNTHFSVTNNIGATIYLHLVPADMYYDQVATVEVEYGQPLSTSYSAFHYSYMPESEDADEQGYVKVINENVIFNIFLKEGETETDKGVFSSIGNYDAGSYILKPNTAAATHFTITGSGEYAINIIPRPIIVTVEGNVYKREGKSWLSDNDASPLSYGYLLSKGVIFTSKYDTGETEEIENGEGEVENVPIYVNGFINNDVLLGQMYSDGLGASATLGESYVLVNNETNSLYNSNYAITWQGEATLTIIEALTLPNVILSSSFTENTLTFSIDSILDPESVAFDKVTYRYNYSVISANPSKADAELTTQVITAANSDIVIRGLNSGYTYKVWVVIVDGVEDNEIISGAQTRAVTGYTTPKKAVASTQTTSTSISFNISNEEMANSYYYRLATSKAALASGEWIAKSTPTESKKIEATGLVSGTKYFMQVSYKVVVGDADVYVTADSSISDWYTALVSKDVLEIASKGASVINVKTKSGINLPSGLVYSCQRQTGAASTPSWTTTPSYKNLIAYTDYLITVAIRYNNVEIYDTDERLVFKVTTESKLPDSVFGSVTASATVKGITINCSGQGLEANKDYVFKYKIWSDVSNTEGSGFEWKDTNVFTDLPTGTKYLYRVAVCRKLDDGTESAYTKKEVNIDGISTLAKPLISPSFKVVASDTEKANIQLSFGDSLDTTYHYWYTVKYETLDENGEALLDENGQKIYEFVEGYEIPLLMTDTGVAIEGLTRGRAYVVDTYFSEAETFTDISELTPLNDTVQEGVRILDIPEPRELAPVLVMILKELPLVVALLVATLLMFAFLGAYRSKRKEIEKDIDFGG